MIGIKARHGANSEGNINDVIWIRRDYNLANGMKKSKVLPQRIDVMKTGKLEYEAEWSVNSNITGPEKPSTAQNKEGKMSECEN